MTLIILLTLAAASPYTKMNAKDAPAKPDQLKRAKETYVSYTTPKKPMTERERKRAAYLAEKERRLQKYTGSNSRKVPPSHGWGFREYGDVRCARIFVAHILDKNSVIAYTDYERRGEPVIVEGIDTTHSSVSRDSDHLYVLTYVNKATYTARSGQTTLQLFKCEFGELR